MNHYPNCRADYPEKVEGEPAQLITEEKIDGYTVRCCVDCGAVETDLPPANDPYWEDLQDD